ncbi:hypothetical protein YC2023_020665 [Brassica napus]
MINFPKPAKQALHLPYLEDPRFTSNQPREWQPGDLISHSEALQNILGSTMAHWIRWIPIKPKDQAGLHQLAKPILFKECLLLLQFGSTKTYLWKPGHNINHPEDIQEVLSCTSTQEIRRISLPINIPYLAATTLNALKKSLQIFIQDQRPYSPSRQLRDMSGRLLDRGYIQKLSRYKIIQDFLLKAQIKLMASSHGAIKAIDSKHFISIYFLFLVHFQTVRESLVEPIKFYVCEAALEHLDLSSLLFIESCGVLNPPSFHSNSFAKLESDTHPVYNLHSIHIAHPIISLVDPSKLPSSISSTLIPSLQHKEGKYLTETFKVTFSNYVYPHLLLTGSRRD